MQINGIYFSAELGEIVNELKSQLTINQIPLLNSIKETPNDIMISCPYHKNGQERRPSAGIRKSDGQFHCFTCGETHSLQEVISHCFGNYDDMIGAYGWNWLLKNFATIQTNERKDIKLNLSRQPKVEKEQEYVSEEELDSYRYYHPYMYKRKLTDEVIELFDIGYDKNTQCITFPIRDVYGHTLFVARRSINSKFFNYPSGAEKPVYGLFELYQSCELEKQEVIICESMIDSLTCWAFGKYAVALNGLGNDLQFEQLRKMPCRKFILATDMDDAGIHARNRIKSNVPGKIITQYKWDKNIAKDINDMTKEYFDNLKELF